MKTLKEFNTFIEEITSSNSKLFKMDVLRKYDNNEVIKKYLNFLFDPYKTTGISEKKINKNSSVNLFVSETSRAVNSTSVFDLLECILKNNTGSDWLLGEIKYFKSIIPEEYKDLIPLLDKVITKNIQLGVDAKTINKVFPNLIPTFNIQLANKYFDNPSFVNNKEFAITTKIDGGRIIAIRDDEGVSFYTRAGQKYEDLVDLELDMINFVPKGTVLDGEITLLDKGNLTSKDQYKQTMKITRKDGEKHGVKMLVFDMLPIEDFKNQSSTIPYRERRRRLEKIFENSDCRPTFLEVLPILYEGNDTSKIQEWLDYNTSNGEEGVMINILDAPYHFSRTNDLLKVKKFQSCDLRVIGFEEGTNKNANSLGAFICEFKDNNVVKVGSGLTDEQRAHIWKNREDFLNTIIEVSYFEETTNSNGGKGLRFPTFKDFRFDKSEPNY